MFTRNDPRQVSTPVQAAIEVRTDVVALQLTGTAHQQTRCALERLRAFFCNGKVSAAHRTDEPRCRPFGQDEFDVVRFKPVNAAIAVFHGDTGQQAHRGEFGQQIPGEHGTVRFGHTQNLRGVAGIPTG